MRKGHYVSPVGTIEITENDGFITSVRVINSEPEQPLNTGLSLLLEESISQLDEYFNGKRFEFDLPLNQQGTPFQQKAWDYLLSIPYGQTVSYKDEAEAIDSPKGCRAVGSANGCNNIAIIVPCHRVINSDKKLGGYAYGLPMKEYLLKMEKQFMLGSTPGMLF